MASPRNPRIRMARGKARVLLAVVAVGAAATVFIASSRHQGHDPAPSSDTIRVVDAAAARRRAITTEAPRSASTSVEAAPPMARVLAEAPAPLRKLHDDVANGVKDERVTRDEGALRQAFETAGTVRFTELTVSCGGGRCEVHGMAEGDETAARMAVRDGPLLDRLAAAGYTSGMDMVSGRGTESEVVVYLDRSDA